MPCVFALSSCSNENHAIVAWFKRANVDERKINKKSEQNVLVSKAPSGRARRVKKICLWHIFSQSGKQAMLATRAEGSAD